MARLEAFRQRAQELLDRLDYQGIWPLLNEMGLEHRRLTQPPPLPMPATEMDRIGNVLVARIADGGCAWSPLEADWLAAWLKPGERVLEYNWAGAKTSTGRVFDRAEMREKMRPGSWTRLDTWNRQFEGHEIIEPPQPREEVGGFKDVSE